MIVRIGADVLKQAKLALGDQVAVFRGRGEDMGRLRLVKATAGFALGHSGKRTAATPATVRFHWPNGSPKSATSDVTKPHAVAFETVSMEGAPGLQLVLPDWATKPAAPAPARRDVTADLMGDPRK